METSSYTKGMERLVLAVQQLSLTRDLDSLMRIVRTVARELTGADGATFVLRDGDRCYYADEDAIAPLWKGSRFPMETCISGWAMLNKKAAVIGDIYQDPRIPADVYRKTFVKSMVMVPVRTLDPVAAIGNYWAEPHAPTSEEVKLLQALADITAVSMENITVYSELEQRVEDRTMRLKELNQELEAFSYSVSHDLRAPIRAINGYMTILLEDYGPKLDEEGLRLANKVLDGATEMGAMVDDLLDFFRLGRKEITRTEVQMKTMLEEICKTCTEHESNRDIEITIPELPAIRGDGPMLRQVFINLVSNAVKYTRNKERAKIDIGFSEESGSIVYHIKDNGAGFDMKYYDKLFGVFQRLHGQDEFEGNGIGLAIVERVAARHGGRVWAEAAPNEGATFYVELTK